MSDLYSKEILRLATQIPVNDLKGEPDVSIQKTSRICGSRVTLKAMLSDDKISLDRFAVEVKACALGQASVGYFAPFLKGMTKGDAMNVRALLADILAGQKDAPLPTDPDHGQWSGLKVFEPARDHKGRHSSILLLLDAVIDALNEG